VFLDPMCGAGTTLIERALSGRYRCLLGGDIDSRAVGAALENIGPRHRPVCVRQWDAAALPLADGSVDKVVANLPFGEQVGSHAHNVRLYPLLLREMARVLRPHGRIVLLTAERQLIQDALAATQKLNLHERHNILLLGMPSTIYVINRTCS
jgi:tRNA (guanine6-N2)-methyltransferase